jgi:predicted nuclease with TOPRIM domain
LLTSRSVGTLFAAILLTLVAGGRVSMAQSSADDLQQQIDQLKKEKEKLDAEKAKLDAQKALLDSQKALDQSKDTAAQKLSDLQNQKSLADAQKALADSQRALQQSQDASNQKLTELQNQKTLADAQKALADAQSQAALAKYIGDVKAGPYSGSVDMKDKAGTEEAQLLAARAVKEAGIKIASAVGQKSTKFYIFAVKDFPNFQRLTSFRFRKELLKQAFDAAGIRKPAGVVEEAVTPAMVSAGLDAFNKILGFFKTDYTIGGIETKLDESLLLFSVAGKLSTAGVEVHLPAFYEPAVQKSTIETLTKELAELIDLRRRAETEVKSLQGEIDQLQKQAADPQNAANKDALLKTVSELKPRLDRVNGVIALFDSFSAFLTTPDTNGAVPLTSIALELAVDDALKSTEAGVLLLRLENTGGGYLLKKNLLTGLGKMPLYHMGGATVTYILLEGPSGKVLGGDILAIHGGFVRTDNLRSELAK